MISTLIIDDEQHQQELLSGMLHKNFPQIQIQHICSSVDEGLEKIAKFHPQLIFLDVMMPPKTGFDLLASVDEINFDVIFTTSFEQFALQAIKLSAIDYLLKPFGIDELGKAIAKYEAKLDIKQSYDHIQNLLYNVNSNNSDKIKIALPTLTGFVFVLVSDIIRCEADNVYTTFYFTNNKSLVVSKSIKDCEKLLISYNFFRSHTSHLINMSYLKEYIKGDGGIIKMTDGSQVDLSRLRKDDFLRLLNRI